MLRRISLRTFLISALLVVLLPIVIASGWFFYRSAVNTTEQFAQQIAEVQKVLVEIGAEQIPQLLVFNKVDAIAPESQPLRLEDEYEIDGVQTPRLFVSARTMAGMQTLRERLAQISAQTRSAGADSMENSNPAGPF